MPRIASIRTKRRLSLALALSATAFPAMAALLTPTQAMASGFYLDEDSMKGAGRANSGEVADQGPESLWWNPASIGGISGVQGSLGAAAIVSSAKVTDNASSINYFSTATTPPTYAGSLPVGGVPATGDPIRNGVVPSGSIAVGLTPRIAVGLAISAPYNFTTQYGIGSWERYDGERTALHTIDLQPSVAVVVIPGLSLGAGLNVERVTATLSNAIPLTIPPTPGLDASQSLTGTGWNVGWSVGGQFKLNQLSLGVSYKSAIKHTLNGSISVTYPTPLVTAGLASNSSINANANFETPWQLVVGARYAITPRLTLNGQVTRFGWSRFDQINLGAPIDSALPENYRNTWTYAFGVDFAAAKDWTVRAGISRDLSPVQDDQRDVRVPDSDRWIFAVGVSHDFSRSISVDLAAQYVTLDSAPLNASSALSNQNGIAQTVSLDGTISDTRVIVLGAGIRFRL